MYSSRRRCFFLKLLGPSPGPQGVGLPTRDTGVGVPVCAGRRIGYTLKRISTMPADARPAPLARDRPFDYGHTAALPTVRERGR